MGMGELQSAFKIVYSMKDPIRKGRGQESDPGNRRGRAYCRSRILLGKTPLRNDAEHC